MTTGCHNDRDWVGFVDEVIPESDVFDWVGQRDCGAIATFSGTVRDHSEDRPPIVAVEYDAYREHLPTRLDAVAGAARKRWPDLGRVALIHRLGRLEVGESSVLIAVSAPHRKEAFEAARFLIDTVKTSAPIWKREHWEGGSDWVSDEHDLVDVEGG
ncbi:MAG: molybdenum cofactor biosynthesis protein MoaE [Acidimicrobiales bacterium]